MLHTKNFKASCQIHIIAYSQVTPKYTPNCSRWHTPSLLDLCSQVSSQDVPKYTSSIPIALHDILPACLTIYSQVSSQVAPKYTRSMLPSTPLSAFSSTLPGILSRTLPIALDGTLPACSTVHYQGCSQDALKYTTEYAFKYTPNCT
jgi:hypothetical protein